MYEQVELTEADVTAVDPTLLAGEAERVLSIVRSALASSDPVAAVYRASRGAVSLTALPPQDEHAAAFGIRELRIWTAAAHLLFTCVPSLDHSAASALVTKFDNLLRDYCSRYVRTEA